MSSELLLDVQANICDALRSNVNSERNLCSDPYVCSGGNVCSAQKHSETSNGILRQCAQRHNVRREHTVRKSNNVRRGAMRGQGTLCAEAYLLFPLVFSLRAHPTRQAHK